MSVGYIDVDPTSRHLVHHQIDQVGNNITRTLAWCDRHLTPVWVYGDGSFCCWWEDVTGHKQHLAMNGPEDHDVVPGPWETEYNA